MSASPSRDDETSGTPDPHKVVMHNGRPHPDEFKLDVDGFRFVHHDTKVQNFFDEAEIRRVYYPEMEALIKAESGAKRSVFDHTLRTAVRVVAEPQASNTAPATLERRRTCWLFPEFPADLLDLATSRTP